MLYKCVFAAPCPHVQLCQCLLKETWKSEEADRWLEQEHRFKTNFHEHERVKNTEKG